MTKKSLIATSLLVAVALSACSREGDPLADGATDEPRDGNTVAAAEDVGPPTVPAQAAGPGVGNSASQPGAAAAGAGSAGATLTLVNQGPSGPYIADAAGMALYYLEGDRDGSKCVGDCLAAWPPVAMGATQPTGAPGLQGAQIASIVRPDGTRQVTFGGHPLYRYAADAGAGTTNGAGVKDKYGTWRLVTPAAGSGAAQTGAAGTPGQAQGQAPQPGGAQ